MKVNTLNRRKFLKLLGLGTGVGVAAAVAGIRLEDLPDLGRKVIVIGSRKALAAGVADYVCNGVQDNVQFQAALDALPSIGGKLVVLAGTYNFTATVARAIDDVVVEGVGFGTLFNNDGATALYSAGSQSGWVFRDLATDAGGLDYVSATNFSMDNVLIGSTYEYSYPHKAILDAHTLNHYEEIKIGAYYSNPTGYPENRALIVNTLYGIPLIVNRDFTIDEIICQVTIQAGQKIRLGIYAYGTDWRPGALIEDVGELVLSSTGVKTFATSGNLALTKGRYFLAIISDGAPTLRSYRADLTPYPPLGWLATDFIYHYVCVTKALAYQALPDPFTAGGNLVQYGGFKLPVHIVSMD